MFRIMVLSESVTNKLCNYNSVVYVRTLIDQCAVLFCLRKLAIWSTQDANFSVPEKCKSWSAISWQCHTKSCDLASYMGIYGPGSEEMRKSFWLSNWEVRAGRCQQVPSVPKIYARDELFIYSEHQLNTHKYTSPNTYILNKANIQLMCTWICM